MKNNWVRLIALASFMLSLVACGPGVDRDNMNETSAIKRTQLFFIFSPRFDQMQNFNDPFINIATLL